MKANSATTSPFPASSRFLRRAAMPWLVPFLALSSACERPAAISLGDAERFVAGPRAAGLIQVARNGTLTRLDVAGHAIATLPAESASGAFVVWEIPDDVEDAAETAPVVLVSRSEGEPAQALVRRWRVNGTVEAIATIPLRANEEARPCVEGTHADGAIEHSTLTLVASESGAPRRALRVDLATGAIEPWPAELFQGEVRFVTASPSGTALGACRRTGESHELHLALRSSAEVHTFPSVDPVAPYWLRDVDALLFVRDGGSIARVLLPAMDAEWLTGGTFTADFARDEVTGRIGDEQRVTVEKMGFDGYAQVCELAPFEVGGSREKQLTSGSVDHYGSTWSSDHRFLAFRQRERGGGRAERIVVIDREENYQATTVASREVDAEAEGIGPRILPGTYRLYFVAEGQLRVVDLDPGKAPLR